MFKTAAELQKRAENLRDASEPSEKEMAIVSALEEVSNEIGNVGLTTGELPRQLDTTHSLRLWLAQSL